MLWQLHPGLAQELRPIDHGVHQQVLAGTESATALPVEDFLHRKHVLIANGMAGVVADMLIDIVTDHQIQRFRHLR